jgi:Xaa-Pro aminopeptidase
LDGKQSTGTKPLLALRDELTRLGLDGLIVPHSDEHQGEYIAPSSKRLAWLTGFTGSAGMAVVLADKAAIFTDGRYTLQAEVEVESGLFERCHLTESPPTDWIAKNLKPGAKLGYDPWLLTPDQEKRFRTASKKAGGTLAATGPNPIDTVWTDQPPPPVTPARAHDDVFTGLESVKKRRQVAADLKKQKLDAAVLTAPDSIAWLLNIRGADVPFTPLALSFAVIHADSTVDLFIDAGKLSPETVDHLGQDIRCHQPDGPDGFGPALDDLGSDKKTVRLDFLSAPVWVLNRLEKAGAAVDRGVDPCQLPKAKKNATELEGIRDAHRRDGASLTRFLAWLAREAPKGGLTEMVCADKVESLRHGNDHFQGLSFFTISGAGANGAIVHYRSSVKTDRTLDDGTLYLVDSGAQYLDGTTDVTRTVAIGEPTGEMRRRFTLVLKGHIALATARFPEGTTGSQLDILARKPLWAEGLDYDHGTGHGVGCFLAVHEGPQRISKRPCRAALEPGMVVSNEPGYYKPGAYGIRIENLVTVVAAKKPGGAEKALLAFETLTLAPLDRTLVDLDMLSTEETQWVDAYHARVMAEIGPLVDKTTAKWLKKAAAPL